MIEIQGNFWDVYDQYDAICCTTNGIIDSKGSLVMGAGIAKGFKETFPSLPKELGRLVKKYGNKSFALLVYDPVVISFPTKHDWKDNSDISLIIKSANEIAELVNINKFEKVLTVRPGCLNGGLSWAQVKLEIATILDDRFTVIEQK